MSSESSSCSCPRLRSNRGHCIYIDDYVGVAMRLFVGMDRILWTSDYPHQASSWPRSQDVVARDFKDASSDDRVKIMRGNVSKLCGFAL